MTDTSGTSGTPAPARSRTAGLMMLAGGVVAVAGAFLKYESVRLAAGTQTLQESATGLKSADGKIIVVLGILLAVLGFRLISGGATRAIAIGGLVLSIVAVLMTLLYIGTISTAERDSFRKELVNRGVPEATAKGEADTLTVSRGLGIYVSLGGAALALIGSVMAPKPRKQPAAGEMPPAPPQSAGEMPPSAPAGEADPMPEPPPGP